MPSKTTLFQFPVSHFCEKARWALDLAEIPYAIKNLAFIEHLVVLRSASRKPQVPLLIHDGRIIADSTAIVRWAAERGAPSLWPTGAAARAEIDALVVYFDAEIGPSVRIFSYGNLFKSPASVFAEAAFCELDPARRAISSASAPVLRALIAKAYDIDRQFERSRSRILAVADRIDARVRDRSFLVGDAFSAADLTAASLFAPVLSIPGTPWARMAEHDASGGIKALATELRERPTGTWIDRLYAEQRVRPQPAG